MSIRFFVKSCAAAIVSYAGCIGAFLCTSAHADDFARNSASAFFYAERELNIENDFFKTELIPVQLMDDQTLFLAAEAERDNMMSHGQKLLNNRWLSANKRNTYNGMRALRNFCKLNFKLYRAKTKNNDRVIEVQHDLSDNTLAITNLRNYSVKLGNDKFILRYKKSFSLN